MHVAARLSIVCFTLVATQLIQCGEDETSTPLCNADPPDEVIYADERANPGVTTGRIASDEAFERVWDKYCAARQVEGAATLVSPGSTEEVTVADLELVWEQTLAAAPLQQQPKPATPATLPRLSFGVRTAAAHLPAVDGWVYLVEIHPAAGAPLWVFTVETSWRPDPVARTRLGEGAFSVRITSAVLNKNVVEEGPWVGDERTFTVVGP